MRLTSITTLGGMLLVACTNNANDTGDSSTPEDTGPPPEPLELPPIDDLDFVNGFQDVMTLALGVHFGVPWDAHMQGLENAGDLCPDWYLGNPAPESIPELGDPQEGLTWWDFCREGDYTFGGFNNINTSVSSNAYSDGSFEDNASRSFIADAAISFNDQIWWELDGEGSDSIYANRNADGATNRWIYTSLVDGTVTGKSMFPEGKTDTPGGYRTDMYLYATGGDEDQIVARGNVLFPEHLIQGRFDSFEVDVSFQGDLGAGPDDCLLEPLGWMGLRDQDAYWYDLVFLPRYDNDLTDTGYPNDPYTACDGCGTLYVRGVNFNQEVGQVCPDFSHIWSILSPPGVEDFIWSGRQQD